MVRAWEGLSGGTLDGLIEGFIRSQVIGRGLDDRTEKAYRLDLEHFSRWLEGEEEAAAGIDPKERKIKEAAPKQSALEQTDLEQKVQRYLYHLSKERKLRTSTISRKGRVFRYFLTYLSQIGKIPESHAPDRVSGAYAPERVSGIHAPDRVSGTHMPKAAGLVGRQESAFGRDNLSKKEIDTFFRTIQREMEELDSDFRRRICLRDLVMMELLFYHGIEVSQLLCLRVLDYDRETGVLTVRRKRGKDRQIYLYSKVLRERMERWLMEHRCFEREGEYREMMFLSKLGRPLSMKMVINIFEKYRERAGIEKAVTPKDLKGSMGTYARELMREICG